MATDGVRPTGPATDAEFLRRVFVDLTGQIPDSATVKAFLADARPDKRSRTIDTLLASDAFVDRWTMWFGDLVENTRNQTAAGNETYVGRNSYYAWIRQSIQQSKPYDQMVRELVAGAGDSFVDGTPNYWVRQMQGNGPIQDTYDNLVAHACEKFHGMQCGCTSCHNGAGHTDLINVGLSTKTRMQFWQSSAFFAMGLATAATDPSTGLRKYAISDRVTGGGYLLNTTSGNKSTRAPVPGQPNVVAPAFYLTSETPRAGQPLRAEYARMLTSHPQFARTVANYLWKEMFGLGIVEPANNFDLLRQDPNNLPPGWSVQPSHPALLDKLAAAFQSGGYDLRAYLRLLANSNAYQLSAFYTPGNWNTANSSYFARRLLRRLPAEMLLDAIVTATGVPPPDTGTGGMTTLLAVGISRVTRAMQLPDTSEGGGSVAFLNVFARGNRDGIERSSDVSAVQALSLMNDGNVVARCRNATAGSNVQRTLKATTDPNAIVDSLYVATLGRSPSATERTRAVAYLKSGTLATKTEDLQFVLLNELEFSTTEPDGEAKMTRNDCDACRFGGSFPVFGRASPGVASSGWPGRPSWAPTSPTC